ARPRRVACRSQNRCSGCSPAPSLHFDRAFHGGMKGAAVSILSRFTGDIRPRRIGGDAPGIERMRCGGGRMRGQSPVHPHAGPPRIGAGLYCVLTMMPVCAAGGAGGGDSAAKTPEQAISASSHSRDRDWGTVTLGTLAELRLQLLRHLQMSLEGRAYLDE